MLALVPLFGGFADLLLPSVFKTITNSWEQNTSLQLDLEMMMLTMAMAGGSSNLRLLPLPLQSCQVPSLKELTF